VSGPLVLVVIDGFGIAPPGPGNAVTLARTPALDALAAEGSATLLQASGLPVGLPDGQMGNSEVGHLNLGAGRRVPQMLVRIDEAVASAGGLGDVPAIAAAFAASQGCTLHLVGLVGNVGVHASQRHLVALLDAARASGVDRVVVHAITDGRDSRPDSALPAIRALEDRGAVIGTVVVFVGAYFVEKGRGLSGGRGLIQLLAMLPMAVPGLVLGLAYVFFFNAPWNPLGLLYSTLLLLSIGFLFLVIGSSLARLTRTGLLCVRDPRLPESLHFENM
jgi:hypothetical protein